VQSPEAGNASLPESRAGITTILWDNDGVLVDTEGYYFQATNDVLAPYGLRMSRKDFARTLLIEGTSTLDAIQGLGGFTEAQIAGIRDERFVLYEKYLAENDLVIPGAVETLDRLSRTFRMGVVTGSTARHLTLQHERTGLLHHFAFCVTADDYEHYKPDPEPYLLAMERGGVRADECIAVEDTPRGLQAAQAAGIACIVVPNKMLGPTHFVGADAVVGSIRDVVGAVVRLIGRRLSWGRTAASGVHRLGLPCIGPSPIGSNGPVHLERS
jgi:HAD superfamily hydrolase (TIGR01509 family)